MLRSAIKQVSWFKPVLTGLMAGLVLLLALFASNGSLHKSLHDEAEGHAEECAVCSIAKGHLDVSLRAVSEVFAPLSVFWTIPRPQNAPPRSADFSVASSRGPPAFVSFRYFIVGRWSGPRGRSDVLACPRVWSRRAELWKGLL